jgi:membrane fusion protein (multidrug efflux system)
MLDVSRSREERDSPDRAFDSADRDESLKNKASWRKLALTAIIATAFTSAAIFGLYYTIIGRFIISTDDAYLRTNITIIAAKVSGHITGITISDNANVSSGDVVVKIDDGDYKLAVDLARGKVLTQQATIARIRKESDSDLSLVDQAKAQLDSTRAAAKRAQFDFDRQSELSRKGFASNAVVEQSQSTRDQAFAGVQSALAALDVADKHVGVTIARRAEAQGAVDELLTSLAKAERDLAFTEVRAAVNGVFANRLVNNGDFVQVGQRLASLVSLDEIFIEANFKETQLNQVRPGQIVSVTVDGVRDSSIQGVVDSISPASGSVFSLLPPDNATGNFTKIVQRLPIRIAIPRADARRHNLRAGMSAVVHVDTRQHVASQTR